MRIWMVQQIYHGREWEREGERNCLDAYLLSISYSIVHDSQWCPEIP
jgi:hypothetical protein